MCFCITQKYFHLWQGSHAQRSGAQEPNGSQMAATERGGGQWMGRREGAVHLAATPGRRAQEGLGETHCCRGAG